MFPLMHPAVVLHTRDWLRGLSNEHAGSDGLMPSDLWRQATAVGLCLCQLLASDISGIDELVYHAPDKGAQLVYQHALQLYWGLLSDSNVASNSGAASSSAAAAAPLRACWTMSELVSALVALPIRLSL
jgi:hypothetical protein